MDKAYLKLMEQKLRNEFDFSESEGDQDIEITDVVQEIPTTVESKEELESKPICNESIPNTNAVKVVVFQHKIKKSVNDKSSYSQFMSPIINKKKPKAVEEKAPKENLDEQDKELDDILQASKLVEQFNAENLVGKERHRYVREKLGAKDPKVSLPIYLGMKKAAEKRVTKKVQDLKNLGLYNPTNERQVIQKERTLRDQDKKKIVKKDHGLVGSLGSYRPGVLSVPKQLIDKVQNGGIGKKRQDRNSRNRLI